MAEYLSPGVYVEEFDSGSKAMEGVSTSTAGFIGFAEKGPTEGRPVLITSLGDYQRVFGGYLPESGYGPNCYMPYAIESFFVNGGASCYVMRVTGKDSAAASKTVTLGGGVIKIEAASVGKWGNTVTVGIAEDMILKTTVTDLAPGTENKRYLLTVKNPSGYTAGDLLRLTSPNPEYSADNNPNAAKLLYKYMLVGGIDGNILSVTASDELTEEIIDDSPIPKTYLQLCALTFAVTDGLRNEDYPQAVLNPASPYYIGKAAERSQLVRISARGANGAGDFAYSLSGVWDGISPKDCKLSGAVKSCVLSGGLEGGTSQALTQDLLTDASRDLPGKRIGLDAFKELKDVSIMSIPGAQSDTVNSLLISHCEGLKSRFAILDASCGENNVSELASYKDKIDTSYAALYHPWLLTYSVVEKKNIFVPPSGAVAGIYARTDTSRGVWKAPANEIVRNCTGLSVNFNEAEQTKLNPKGINLIRAIPSSGIRVWGARTLSSDGNWKYVNVRRLFIYVEESIRNSLNWAVFEPNDANLWSRVQGTVKVFLTTLWRNGGLAGSSADEAMFVNVGKGTTMTEDDINNGRLICEIGIAPVKPAEFIIFRITQKMQEN